MPCIVGILGIRGKAGIKGKAGIRGKTGIRGIAGKTGIVGTMRIRRPAIYREGLIAELESPRSASTISSFGNSWVHTIYRWCKARPQGGYTIYDEKSEPL